MLSYMVIIFSRGSQDLTPSDLILLSVQAIAAQEYWNEIENSEDNKDQDAKDNSHLPCKLI